MRKLLKRTTGFGHPTGRVNNSVMFRCRLSFAGRRIAYFTVCSSSASYSSGLAKAASARKTTSLSRLLAFNLGHQQFLPALGAVDIARPQFAGEASRLHD